MDGSLYSVGFLEKGTGSADARGKRRSRKREKRPSQNQTKARWREKKKQVIQCHAVIILTHSHIPLESLLFVGGAGSTLMKDTDATLSFYNTRHILFSAHIQTQRDYVNCRLVQGRSENTSFAERSFSVGKDIGGMMTETPMDG